MLNSTINPNDFASGSAAEAEADKQLLVKFYYKPRKDKALSAELGVLKVREVEYIEIRVPGQRDPLAARPATFSDKQRFAEHYAKFKARVEAPVDGTPLAEWPQVSRSQVEELAYLNVKTVEQLAAVADGNIGNIMGGVDLKAKAVAFLEQGDEIGALKAKVADLEAQLAEALKDKKPAKSTLSTKSKA